MIVSLGDIVFCKRVGVVLVVFSWFDFCFFGLGICINDLKEECRLFGGAVVVFCFEMVGYWKVINFD